MTTRDLVTVSADIASSKQYKALLADCREICESARQSVIEHFWRLGERIRKELPSSREDSYGTQIVLALEKDLAVDRTTLWRAVQVFETYKLPQILDTRARMLTWRKLRMLLPLPDDLRKQIEGRIYSGELRTDDQVRLAILELKQSLGMLPPPALGIAQQTLFGIKGLELDKLGSIWRKARPVDRCLTLRALIPELGLEGEDRREALQALRATRAALDEYEQRLGEGG